MFYADKIFLGIIKKRKALIDALQKEERKIGRTRRVHSRDSYESSMFGNVWLKKMPLFQEKSKTDMHHKQFRRRFRVTKSIIDSLLRLLGSLPVQLHCFQWP